MWSYLLPKPTGICGRRFTFPVVAGAAGPGSGADGPDTGAAGPGAKIALRHVGAAGPQTPRNDPLKLVQPWIWPWIRPRIRAWIRPLDFDCGTA